MTNDPIFDTLLCIAAFIFGGALGLWLQEVAGKDDKKK